MFFSRKKEDQLLHTLGAQGENYWQKLRQRFRKNKLALWSTRLLFLFIFIAVFADFIANEKPIYYQKDGVHHFPILGDYATALGLAESKKYIDWRELKADVIVRAPIPYSHNSIDQGNSYLAPAGNQKVSSKRYWHWLGTHSLGRDVAAGMIRGTRVALIIGILSMGIATILGLFFGSLAGYLGDDRLKVSRIRLILNIMAFPFAVFYAFVTRSYLLSQANSFYTQLLISLLIFIAIIFAVNIIATALKRVPFLGKKVTIALDLLIMRLIEIVNSIPGLLLILAFIAIVPKPSLINIMVFIGLIRWTSIARFIRAELLRIRNLEYMEAAQALGFSDWRIILKHAIPNALTPVLITIAFGIASAILIEAILSFLGIGTSADNVTWGYLVSEARESTTYWWLAIIPGFAIFITVTLFNLIGEGLMTALDSKQID